MWVVTEQIVADHKPGKWLGEPGEVPVVIPDAFYKIMIREDDEGKIEVLAFIYDQGVSKRNGGYDHTPHLVSVDEIEELTGLDFLSLLEDDTEAEIEKATSTKLWNSNSVPGTHRSGKNRYSKLHLPHQQSGFRLG